MLTEQLKDIIKTAQTIITLRLTASNGQINFTPNGVSDCFIDGVLNPDFIALLPVMNLRDSEGVAYDCHPYKISKYDNASKITVYAITHDAYILSVDLASFTPIQLTQIADYLIRHI